MSPTSRLSFGLLSILAWTGFIGSFTIEAFALVVSPQTSPAYFGGHGTELAGALPRIWDNMSYFTLWSVFMVAFTSTYIYRNPNSTKYWLKVTRLSAILMTTISGVVWIVILAPVADPQSWNVYTNIINHYLVPSFTVLFWLLFGPRNWINWKIVRNALVIPIFYIFYTFIRGAFLHQYPYGFVNVEELGYLGALIGTLSVLVVGIVLLTIFFSIDKVLSKFSK